MIIPPKMNKKFEEEILSKEFKVDGQKEEKKKRKIIH